MSAVGIETDVPLCVNCERALLKTNVIHEAIFLLLKRNSLYIFLLPFWFLQGKSRLLQRLVEQVRVNWHTMPFREHVVEHVRAAQRDNRQVVLLTSMPETWARQLTAELACQSTICIGEQTLRTSGERTGSHLTELFGTRGFDYIGDGRQDLPIRKLARRSFIVTADRAAITRADIDSTTEGVIPIDRTAPLAFLKMIRIHQWLKNFLIWVPLLAAHRLMSFGSIGVAAVSFMAFSFCASSVYVLNDLLDLESDRQHIRKRNRPMAAGTISVNQALIVGVALLVAAAWLAWRVSALFTLTLGIYFAMTLAYSLRLKRQVIVDVMLLAALYTIRVVAGAVATTVVPSFWLLAFSMFLFLSLAVVKRYSEMLVTLSEDRQYAAGRGYSVQDMPVLLSLGIGAGIAAIVVLALYINDPVTSTLYPSTIWLWPVPPLMLYWVSRVWMKAHRGEMHDDPVLFAMRDWQSLVTLVLGGTCFAAATMAGMNP
jgi:4-hydroxybenzoate polyprenyltransferase